jgi:hypothetical protein
MEWAAPNQEATGRMKRFPFFSQRFFSQREFLRCLTSSADRAVEAN